MGCTIGIPAPHSELQSFPVSCAVMLGSLTSESCLATAVIHFFNADLDANAPGHLGAGTDQSGKALLTLAWSQDCSTGTLGHSTRSPMGPRMIEAVLHKTLDHTRAPSSVLTRSQSTAVAATRRRHEATDDSLHTRLRDPQVPVDSRLALWHRLSLLGLTPVGNSEPINQTTMAVMLHSLPT